MSEIDFQNGFICGMATKGLVRSGEQYKPTVWNDSGVFGYFYIDFRRAISTFSLGMFNESIIVYDSERITVTDTNVVSTGVYKVFCDLTGKNRGVTVINKKTTLLSFVNGQPLPVFSVMFYISGIEPMMRMAYAFDLFDITSRCLLDCADNAEVVYSQYFASGCTDSATYSEPQLTMADTVDISYWNV